MSAGSRRGTDLTDAAAGPAPAQNDADYHVFLCYNNEDKPTVKELGTLLRQRGLTVWLDEWELRPGLTWHDALEDIIRTCRSAAVCVGGIGVGPWEDAEMAALLRRFANEKKAGNVVPVIPVLLPGAAADTELPVFLQGFTRVDLRAGLDSEGVDRLEWGITGIKPVTNGGQDPGTAPPVPVDQMPEAITDAMPTEAAEPDTVPSRESADEVADDTSADQLLPRVVRFLRSLPEERPELHRQTVTMLCGEIPRPRQGEDGEETVELMDVVWEKGINNVLEALYRGLERPASLQVDVDGWREVMTHLVVMAAADAQWLRQARAQERRNGLVTVGKEVQPLSAAILVGGIFDVAIRLEGAKPAGFVPITPGRGSKGPAVEDRFQQLKEFLQKEYRKYLTPGTESLDENGVKQMLLSDRGQNHMRFTSLPAGDPLAETIGQKLDGLLTVLREDHKAADILDQSFRLVKNIQDLLSKLQQTPDQEDRT